MFHWLISIIWDQTLKKAYENEKITAGESCFARK